MNTSNQRRRSYIEYRLCRNLKTWNSAQKLRTWPNWKTGVARNALPGTYQVKITEHGHGPPQLITMASGLGARRKIVDVSPQMRTAINHNLRFLQQHPHNIEGHHNLAVLYLHANKDSPLLLEAAIKHLEVSLKGDAAHVPSLVDMAVALLRKKQARQAELLCRRALKCDACSAMAFNTLASALAAQEKIGKAMKNITQALYYAPRSAAVHRNAAALLRAQAQTHAAIEHYLIIVEIEPTDVNTYIHLQSALISEGRPKEAYKYAKIVNDLTGGRFRRAI